MCAATEGAGSLLTLVMDRLLLSWVYLLCLLLVAAPSALGAADDMDVRKQLDNLQAGIAELEQTLGAERVNRQELAQRLQKSDRAVSATAGALRRAEQDLQRRQSEVQDMRLQVQKLEEQEQQQRKALQKQIYVNWLLSRRDPLQAILQVGSPGEVARLLYFYRTLTARRLAAIGNWSQARSRLAQQLPVLDSAMQAFTRQRDDLAEQLADLQKLRRQRAKLLADLDVHISRRETSRAQMLARRRRLQSLLDGLPPDTQPPTMRFAAAKGRMPWPLPPRIVRAFGDTEGDMLSGSGVLLAATTGTPVASIAPGKVVFADWMRSFGMMLIIDHGDNYLSLYSQADELLQPVGAQVQAGDTIATSGQSGGSSQPGIWFEIHHRHKPQDPVNWCLPR